MEIFNIAKEILKNKNLNYVQEDLNRPWGGFLVIDENNINNFIDTFFSEIDKSKIITQTNQKLSPKLLIVNSNKRLSWQYHNRRSELWKVIYGTAGIITSKTNEETPLKTIYLNEIITLEKGERHRLVGLDKPAIIAEIWQHTDKNIPSDENDIIRVQDDFGR